VDALTAVLAILVAIAILFEIARRLGVPYPTLLVLGGLGLAFVPGLPRIKLEPDLVLLVFLPPLLFSRGSRIADPGFARESGRADPSVDRSRDLHDGHRRGGPGLRDRTQHLATEDPDETAERRQERLEHEEIQQGIIAAQRTAVIELRDRGEINDQTLRAIERELDLEELRMEG